MRLSKIKLAGFKSFVDPTTIEFSSNLTGIVGPNGCGKSNTIDAVRWVMGESSAKHLRGDSMEDVIFNGSSARQPVGQATVELVFDNSDASLGGEYAKYSEIAIKRQVVRDGVSKYFLNGSKCRRRDITDIFLGTGLGPRSYAIIEQGMISRLIDAKPEELRVYLEEAAGISKYRQRRRETENRIRHTRENLDRLSDLRDEIDKHLNQLKRQSNAAERYKKHKESERLLEAELLVLRHQEIHASITRQEDKIGKQGILQQEKIAVLRALEASIEEQRSMHTTANDEQNTFQGEFYRLGAEISRIEQAIKHQQEALARFEQQCSEIDRELETSNIHLTEDQATEKFSSSEIDNNRQELDMLGAHLVDVEVAYETADTALNEWQTQWSMLQESIAKPTQQAQVERARMEQIERQIQQHKHRQERLANSDSEASVMELLDTVETHKTDLLVVKDGYLESAAFLQQVVESAEILDSTIQELQVKQNQLRAEQQASVGKLASLTALQQASLGKDKKKVTQWLQQQGLAGNQRLAESLQIESGWETALETVLGSHIESVQLADFDTLTDLIEQLPGGISLSFHHVYDSSVANDVVSDVSRADTKRLLDKMTNPPSSVTHLLAGIQCANDLQEALAYRHQLSRNESIICKNGLWLGVGWLRVIARDSKNAAQESVLTREQDIKSLTAHLATLDSELIRLSETLTDQQQQLKETQQQRSQAQNQHNELHRQQSKLENAINTFIQRIEYSRVQQKQNSTERTEISQQISALEDEHVVATANRNEAVTLVETLSGEKDALQAQQATLTEHAKNTRQQMLETQAKHQQITQQIASLKQTRQQAQQHITRTHERIDLLTQRKEQMQATWLQQQTPDEDHSEQLESLLQQRQQSEDQLKSARTTLQAIDHQIRTLNEQRIAGEKAVETVRSALETMKLTWQESSVRMKTVLEQFAETDFELKELENALPEDATIKQHQKELEQIKGKIQRLGAINLAAIDEFEQESERKTYLDQQNDDLLKALDTLETAISKIDRDTRSMFKDTFDQVNSRIGDMFPRLFGGGKAYLEMTDNNLLTTGIVIMAQPPGKKISNIHLLSGGEKALTAASMVFAIFELNPAPFCMLDEVDAPLDEANVRRFANLVKHMSERIQFIFITHNKTTMEVAKNLIGVTMRELGVSRTVSVNISDAAAMSRT